jgi:serine/threonine protein phosphatase 1
VIARLFKTKDRDKAAAPSPSSPSLPAGQRVYAIGDIHGRADLLKRLLKLIEDDNRRAAPARVTIVYLGDYIDRGPASREVVDIVMAPHKGADRVVWLRGNHEDALLAFIDDHQRGRLWLEYGGMATLHSYGVRIPPGVAAQERFPLMARQFAALLPSEHRAFYHGLSLSETIGDYFFVHAGVNPRQPIDAQEAYDLTTIRSPFLEWGRKLEKIVVHGHSIAPEPEFRAWRIGIDTGAYATGHLTCLALEGTSQRILAT